MPRPPCPSGPLTSLERVNDGMERRTDVVAVLPDDAAVEQLVDTISLEQNDAQAVQRSLPTAPGCRPLCPKAVPAEHGNIPDRTGPSRRA